jgi:hypothetical protein
MKTRVYVVEEIPPSVTNNLGGKPSGTGQLSIPEKWSLVEGGEYRFVVLNKKGGVAYGCILSTAKYFNNEDSFVGEIQKEGKEGGSQKIDYVREVLKRMTSRGKMNVIVIDPVGNSPGVIAIVEV